MEQNKCPFQGTARMKLGLNTKPSVHCIGSSLHTSKHKMGLYQTMSSKVPALFYFAGTFS